MANRYFVSHPNPSVSGLVTDLIAREYQLSRIHNKYGPVKQDEEMLDALVPRVMTELKWKMLKIRMEQVRQQLKEAQEQGNQEKLMELIKEMTLLQNAFKYISHQHGERTII
jgi:DNA primase